MDPISAVAAQLAAQMPVGVLTPTPPAPYTLPNKPVHLFTAAELAAAIAHCPTCGGIGYLRYADDLPLTDERFGKLQKCPTCAPYLYAQIGQAQLENMRPVLERYSMLTGELLAKTFDNFDKQRAPEACAAVREWATNIYRGSAKHPWLYLCGAPGSGKTHLAAAAANGLSRAPIAVVFSTFTELCGMAARNDFADKEAAIQALQRVPVLLVDDVTEQEIKTDWKQSVLFRLLDTRYVHNRPTMLVSNLPLTAPHAISLASYEPRIASRLSDKHLCQLVINTAPDYRIR